MTLTLDRPAPEGTGDLLTVSLGYLREHHTELLDEVRCGCVVRLVDMRDRSIAGYIGIEPPPAVTVTDAGDRAAFRPPRVAVGEIDGMTAAELAELTGRTPGAIRQARCRARKRAEVSA